jgi:pimeloyl-ACP methyl ester carboxylesterase
MGEMNADDTRRQLEDPVAARRKCEQDREEMLTLEPEPLADFLRTLLSPVDAAVLTGELAQFLVDSTRAGLAPGPDGWWDDSEAFLKPWGFEFTTIRTPVLLHHGRQDRFVPFGHGEWLARQIPRVEARLTEDDGHLTLIERHLDDIHAWLLARLG